LLRSCTAKQSAEGTNGCVTAASADVGFMPEQEKISLKVLGGSCLPAACYIVAIPIG
jgi:hypothetical protein